MKSQVSFKFDGTHNIEPVKNILKRKLNKPKFKLENENKYVYRIYVSANNTDEEVMNVCKAIQSYAVYDNNREL